MHVLVVAAVVMVAALAAGCGSDPAAGPAGTTGPTTAGSTTTVPATTTTTKVTVPVAALPELAKRVVLAPDALVDVGGTAGDEHADKFVLASSCEVDLLVERSEWANYYRDWSVPGGVSVRSLGFAYPKSTGAEVINELGAALAGCDRWPGAAGEEFVLIRDAQLVRPQGLSAFYGYCFTLPDGSGMLGCSAFLGHGNLVARLSVTKDGGGPQVLDLINRLLPRAAQTLVAG